MRGCFSIPPGVSSLHRPVLARHQSEMEVLIVAPAKCEIRSIIRFLHAKGTSSANIHRKMNEVYSDSCMSVQHVRQGGREFSACRKDIGDKERSARPSVSNAIIKMVQREVLQNRRITVRELAARIPGSSYGTVARAVTEKLGYQKCCGRSRR